MSNITASNAIITANITELMLDAIRTIREYATFLPSSPDFVNHDVVISALLQSSKPQLDNLVRKSNQLEIFANRMDLLDCALPPEEYEDSILRARREVIDYFTVKISGLFEELRCWKLLIAAMRELLEVAESHSSVTAGDQASWEDLDRLFGDLEDGWEGRMYAIQKSVDRMETKR